MRNRELEPFRKRTVSRAAGRVLEIGLGSGLNLPFYSDRALEVLGIEPHVKLLAMAARKSPPVPIRLIEGSAESIPLETASIDTVLTTWTLCTIPDVAAALAEMRRVLKSGGQLLFVEHGLAPEEKVRRWQSRLTPLWKRIAGGCHLDRAIPTLVREAGFRISGIEAGYISGPKAMTYLYEGRAQPV
jgi:ubiquinone/menaquinone biosynthesis C-methylase UbiE